MITVVSILTSYICIHKKVQQHLFLSLQAQPSMTERHSRRRQTAKVIIICGHAAPHLTDGDNLSQRFSIKKTEHKQTEGKRNTHTPSHVHIKGVHTSCKNGNDLEELIPH